MTSNLLIGHNTNCIDDAWWRWLKTLPLAAVITAGLFIFMERLIASKPVAIPETMEYVVPEIVMDVVEPQVRRDIELVKPKTPEAVPQFKPEKFEMESQGPTVNPMRFSPGDPVKPEIGNFSSNVPIATVLVQPEYPFRAASRGIEGYVDVQFDVTATGATTNIQVIAANPEKYFENAARKAVKNWKYSPVMKDGKPQPFQGLQQRLVFTLADA